jgi:hypothetical protein
MTYTLPKDSYLIHGSPDDYSPAKAHEYYMRTRKLHPRIGGVARQPVGRSKAVKKTISQPKVTKTNPHLAAQKAYASQRVSELTRKLADLTAELQKRLEKASKPKEKRTRTSADKQKASQESKKYRTTHKQQIANKRKQTAGTSDRYSSMSTDQIKREIVNIKGKLKAAVAAQRQQLANGHGR